MEDVDLAYIAGFFDGEGSVGIYYNKSKKSHGLHVQIVQNIYPESTDLFSRLVGEYGGYLAVINNRKYNWTLAAVKAKTFLDDILPYTVLKKEQIKVAVYWQEQRVRTRASTGEFLPMFKGNDKRYAEILKDMKGNQ